MLGSLKSNTAGLVLRYSRQMAKAKLMRVQRLHELSSDHRFCDKSLLREATAQVLIELVHV